MEFDETARGGGEHVALVETRRLVPQQPRLRAGRVDGTIFSQPVEEDHDDVEDALRQHVDWGSGHLLLRSCYTVQLAATAYIRLDSILWSYNSIPRLSHSLV